MKEQSQKPRVVIVGAGFGGLTAAKKLRNAPVQVTLIDRNNHHLFQPLLYQVATAGLSAADIAVPIRSVLRKNPSTEVLMAEVTGVDQAGKKVRLDSGNEINFDYLVIATGSQNSYFNHPEWEEHALGLKSLDTALTIRERILSAFEAAEMEPNPDTQRSLLTFVVIGGGPTGVEMAGSIAELAHFALEKDFRRINPKSTRVILVEAGSRILATFPEKLSAHATRTLQGLGVEVLTGLRVNQIDATGVDIAGERIPACNLIWAAGVRASPAGEWLEAAVDRQGKVKVGVDLTLPGFPDIFVIGDTANSLDEKGNPYPGLAPVALQQGRFVADVIAARLKGKKGPVQFRYFDKGSMATIGRARAIAQIGRLKLRGWPAWMAWIFIHILYLVGFKNRVAVLFQWAWYYFTYKRGARLIVRDSGTP